MEAASTLQKLSTTHGTLAWKDEESISSTVMRMAEEAIRKCSGHLWWRYKRGTVRSKDDVRQVIAALRLMPGHESWYEAQAIQKELMKEL